MTLEEALTPDGNVAADAPVPLKAEDIWPFVMDDPTFEDYLHWLSNIEHKKQLMAGLNMPRTYTPRPYQLDGAIHFREVVRGMIYDQPGLGKTLQASMALTVPCIISCPGYLVDQWCDFLADQYPQWKVARINALLPRWDRQELLNDLSHDIWVVNHEMWAARREPYKGPKKPTDQSDPNYDEQLEIYKDARESHMVNAKTIQYKWPRARTLVIDESHHMRNKDASQSMMIAHYADTCDQVCLLTATPSYKDVGDWWHQLRIMNPRKYKSYFAWRQEYTYATGYNENIIKVKPYKDVALKADIAELAIGRTYKEVGLYLPPIIEKVVKVPWHPDLKKAYLQIKQNLIIQTQNGFSMTIDPGAALHALRMMTANPEKIEGVRNIIADIPDDGNPIIVFCWYRSTAEVLEAEFNPPGLGGAVEITGAYNQKERLRRATALDTRVKCVTMASMSEGVDWSKASTVIFFEEDYTPGKIYQALSRVRRHSTTGERTDPILVYYVHVKDSVDEAVHTAVTERQADIRAILRRALK
jgi:superfamily II DNA or RNA helicase